MIDSMKLDATTFGEWEVDYVKLDGCYASVFSMDEGKKVFHTLLRFFLNSKILNKWKKHLYISF